MGRRSLPKVDPLIDLSGFLSTVDALPNPWSAEAHFGDDRPVEIEIGSGKGLFLRTEGAARSDVGFLGVEIAGKYARYAAARAAKAGLSNVRVAHGDARRVTSELLPAASMNAVHVYFPDPWWKKRHHKRRIMNKTFVKDIERVLAPGSRLHFWTDVEEYFTVAVETLKTHTSLAGPYDVSERPPEHDLDYRTHFERRMRKHGLCVYRSEWVKE